MSSDFGILCLDGQWRIKSVSPGAAALLGAGEDGAAKIEGMLLDDLIPGASGNGKPSPETLETALLSKGGIFVTDFSCSKGGESFIFCISARRGSEFGDRDVAELYRQNKKLTAIGIFSGGIAHDYNNALTAVLGNISLAKFESESNRELLDLLNDAEKASLRIKVLTERLSSYSRGIKLTKTKIKLAAIAGDICSQKRLKFDGTINGSANDNMTEAEGDLQLITMAVECVIQNSIEAVQPAKGIIDIETSVENVEQEEIFREIALIPGRYIRLTIRDNGSGIAPDKLPDIFNPYFTTKQDHDGIGLALAYSILKRHRGYISVSSVPDQGSTFSLYIPLF